jgi:PTH1 family peptidyl-tRNA hydrolase
MKYLIVGLGNMGAEYDNTRHNIGFDVIDHLAEKFEASFKHENLGDIATIKHKGRQFILLKPSTYMNRSGKAVRYWMTKTKVNIKNVLVVVDDMNLPFGTMRMRAKGADGGHNGLRDIQQTLGNSNYPRIRIGIGREFYPGEQVDYVLGKWSPDQKTMLDEIIKKAGDAALSFGTIGMSHTMTAYNN